MAIGSISISRLWLSRWSFAPDLDMPVGPFIFRVMTDLPGGHGGGAGQARHRDQLSVNVARSRHMTILRKGRRFRANAPIRRTA